jgi:hypothetical protein
MEDIATNTFGYRHAQVDIESDPGDAHTGIVFVRRSQICVIVMMVVMRMSRMTSRLNCSRNHWHSSQRR